MASIINLLHVSSTISLRMIFRAKKHETAASRFLGDARLQVCVNGNPDGPMVNAFLRQKSDGTLELNDHNGFNEQYKGSEIPGLSDCGIDANSLLTIRNKIGDKGTFIADFTVVDGKLSMRKLTLDDLASANMGQLSGNASALADMAEDTDETTGESTPAADESEKALGELED